ncbi:MAG: hypothetical protein QMC67_17375 [Candidatus Wallbacteria bacterium]
MRILKFYFILFFSILSFTALNLTVTAHAAPPGSEDAIQKLKIYQKLLTEQKSKGLDTTSAEALDAKSREAAKNGNPKAASKFLDDAIKLLRSQSSDSSRSIYTNGANHLPQDNLSNNNTGIPDNNEHKFTNRPGATMTGPDARRTNAMRRYNGPPNKRQIDFPEPAGGETPIFVMPFTHHYEGPGGYYAKPSEVRKIAEFFHKYNLPGTLFFDGILVDILKKEDPGIFELINSYKLPLGYHGEETHGPYPVASDLCAEVYQLKEAGDYKGQWSITTGLFWDEAVKAVTERYSYTRPYIIDEKTGMLDRTNPSKTDNSRIGGLKLVQQVFGRDIAMMPSHALESAPEGYAFRKMSSFGFDQPAVPTALHALKIFKVSSAADRIMAIAGKNVSIFWFMGRLTCKGDEMGEATWMPVYLKKLNNLDRSQPRLLVMGFSKFEENDAAEVVKYMNDKFFPKNPGSKWVSGETLAENFEGEKEIPATAADISLIASSIIKNWAKRPADMIETDSKTYSLSDAYEALARALAYYSREKKLPERVKLSQMYGPVSESGAALLKSDVKINIKDIISAANNICSKWDSQSGDLFIPAESEAGSVKLNCAEMLYSMASAYQALTGGAAETITIPPSNIFPPYADALDILFKPKAAQPLCYTKGQLWTVKPAKLKSEKSKNKASDGAVKEGGPNTENTARKANSPEAKEKPVTSHNPKKIEIVFASNLESTGGCYREDNSGADLYKAVYDISTGKASDLKRLTSQTASAEWFPSLSPDGKFTAYNLTNSSIRGPLGNEIRIIDMNTFTDSEFCRASRFPYITNDSQNIVFSHYAPKTQMIAAVPLALAGKKVTPGNMKIIAEKGPEDETIEDPSVSGDCKWAAYHRKAKKGGAGIVISNFDGTGSAQKITPPLGFGHAAVHPNGKIIACSSSKNGNLAFITFDDGKWSNPVDAPLPTKASDYVKYDKRYNQVSKVSHSYMEWVGPQMLIVSCQGADDSNKFHFSRLLLLKWKSFSQAPEIFDISSAIEELAAKTSRDFCTASARILE